MNGKRKTIVIQVTENCNLNCIYCYQNEKRKKSIGNEKLLQIVLDSFDLNNGFDEIEFDFIGGEPMLCFTQIQETCEFVWNKCINSLIYFL
jgi:sulfatase maturation enzyme AslB (radical SAM superfamily)